MEITSISTPIPFFKQKSSHLVCRKQYHAQGNSPLRNTINYLYFVSLPEIKRKTQMLCKFSGHPGCPGNQWYLQAESLFLRHLDIGRSRR